MVSLLYHQLIDYRRLVPDQNIQIRRFLCLTIFYASIPIFALLTNHNVSHLFTMLRTKICQKEKLKINISTFVCFFSSAYTQNYFTTFLLF